MKLVFVKDVAGKRSLVNPCLITAINDLDNGLVEIVQMNGSRVRVLASAEKIVALLNGASTYLTTTKKGK